MTDKELKKLSRKDLLELLIEQGSEVERLKERLAAAEEKVQSRDLQLEETGSIAEASLALSGIFTAAQEAADTYLENIRKTDAECESKRQVAEAQAASLTAEAEEKAAARIADAEAKAAAREADAEEKASNCIAKAKVEAEQYWTDVTERLERFYEEHAGLKELLNIGGKAREE